MISCSNTCASRLISWHFYLDTYDEICVWLDKNECFANTTSKWDKDWHYTMSHYLVDVIIDVLKLVSLLTHKQIFRRKKLLQPKIFHCIAVHFLYKPTFTHQQYMLKLRLIGEKTRLPTYQIRYIFVIIIMASRSFVQCIYLFLSNASISS